MTSAAEDVLTYVYAVVPRAHAPHEALAGIAGVLGSPVRYLDEPGPPADAGAGDGAPGGLAFVVSAVPRRDFDEAALKDHFEDLDWLESVARAHHDVVQTLAGHATVLPLRMATVYEDDARAREALVRRRAAFAERLARLEAQTEFGVKMYLVRSDAAGPGAEPAPEAALSPGKAYLQRRKAHRHAQEAVHAQARLAAEAIEAAAARHASQRVRHAAQSGALTGPEENVLNDAYLVPDDLAETFRAAVTDAARDFTGVRVDVTGPWAPYSFVTPPDEAEDAPDERDAVDGPGDRDPPDTPTGPTAPGSAGPAEPPARPDIRRTAP
ncbi:GvpL/GvpF family gas vesicle protein [Streptomyces sp. NPDC054861]